ncbi:hypothetical protein V8E51_004764 [Hyaloscypha variabilis]
MLKATSTQTQTAEIRAELAALSSAGKSIPPKPPARNNVNTPDGTLENRRSLSDLYGLEKVEIGTAAVRNIPPQPTPDRRRLRLRDIKSNKIAHRTFNAMIIFGIVGLVYEYTSLGSQFWSAHTAARRLELQIQAGTDARQSMAYAFLAECANRKSNSLPLGPDCIKHLEMTPKAPSDILRWVVNSTATNASSSILDIRSMEDSYNVPLNGSLLLATSETERLQSSNIWVVVLLIEAVLMLFVLLFILRCGLWGFLSLADRYTQLLFGREVFRTIGTYVDSRVEGTRGRRLIRIKIISLTMIWLLISLSVFFYIWNVKYHLESWSATSAFLEICKLRQAEDLPLGEDCLNYMAKELKPAPHSTAFDIFALLSLIIGGLGVLAIILAVCAYHPHPLRYLTSMISIFLVNLWGPVETERLPPSTIFLYEQRASEIQIPEFLEYTYARDLRNSETRI